MNSDRLANIAFAFAATVFSVVFAATRLTNAPVGAEDEPPNGRQRGLQDLSRAGLAVRTSASGTALVEFGDYQCPACRSFHRTLSSLMVTHAESLSVRYVYFPLPGNQWGYTAARGAECARQQGHWAQYHDALYSASEPLGYELFDRLATEVGLSDTASFQRCVRDSASIPAIDAGIALGESLKVRHTPTIFVGNWRINGAPKEAFVDSLVSAATTRSWWPW
jgi:protein-disulfide isomerase